MLIPPAIISLLLVPAVVLAGPFASGAGQQQNLDSYSKDIFVSTVSYVENSIKMPTLERNDIKKVIISESSSFKQGSSNYVCQQADDVSDASSFAHSSLIYAKIPSSASLLSVPAQITPQVSSNDDDYFSQSESSPLPDLSSFPPDSPFIRNWPEIPDEAPPKIGLPKESSGSV